MTAASMITQGQIRFIHSLISRLKWDDEKYRAALQERCQVRSSKSLTKKQAVYFSRWLESLASQGTDWQPKSQATGPEYASAAQRAKLWDMWLEASRAETYDAKEAAFRNLLRNKAGVDDARWLQRKDVPMMFAVIKDMIRQKHDKETKPNKEAV